ncbi:hypothetical protein WR25_25469 [Diploscapter pachys]|uniref:Uncharacterized protein n=1 Tax=Diploscapter pachys TaxID=2018661 RepID=A0A2A2JNW9_9BILA|nr:hypothetical protein WR25_25469 [Diploscapter pachys]
MLIFLQSPEMIGYILPDLPEIYGQCSTSLPPLAVHLHFVSLAVSWKKVKNAESDYTSPSRIAQLRVLCVCNKNVKENQFQERNEMLQVSYISPRSEDAAPLELTDDQKPNLNACVLEILKSNPSNYYNTRIAPIVRAHLIAHSAEYHTTADQIELVKDKDLHGQFLKKANLTGPHNTIISNHDQKERQLPGHIRIQQITNDREFWVTLFGKDRLGLFVMSEDILWILPHLPTKKNNKVQFKVGNFIVRLRLIKLKKKLHYSVQVVEVYIMSNSAASLSSVSIINWHTIDPTGENSFFDEPFTIMRLAMEMGVQTIIFRNWSNTAHRRYLTFYFLSRLRASIVTAIQPSKCTITSILEEDLHNNESIPIGLLTSFNFLYIARVMVEWYVHENLYQKKTAQEWSVRASAVLHELSAPNLPESTQSLHVEDSEMHTAITAETVTLSKRSKLKASLEMVALSVLRSRKSNKKELTSKPPSKARNRKPNNISQTPTGR